MYISGPCTVSFTPATMPSGPLQHFMIFICSARRVNGTVSQMPQNAEQALPSPAMDPPAPDQPEKAGENLSDEDNDAGAARDKKKRQEAATNL